MTQCWGIRGATTVSDNTADHILAATQELLEEMINVNQISKDQIVAAWFTTTQDLDAVFTTVVGFADSCHTEKR